MIPCFDCAIHHGWWRFLLKWNPFSSPPLCLPIVAAAHAQTYWRLYQLPCRCVSAVEGVHSLDGALWLCVVWSWSMFLLLLYWWAVRVKSGRMEEMWEFSHLAARLSGDVRSGCSASHCGSNWGISAKGWAGRRGGGEEDPVGVWLHSNLGDYYHWDTRTHTIAGICCSGVNPDSRGLPPVRVDNVFLYDELRYHSGCRIGSLSSFSRTLLLFLNLFLF